MKYKRIDASKMLDNSYYRPEILQQREFRLQILDQDGTIIYEKKEEIEAVVSTGLMGLKNVIIKMPQAVCPTKVILKVELLNSDIFNQYEVWVFPKECPQYGSEEIVISEQLDKTIEALKEGRKVFFLPVASQNPNSIKGTYCTDFWCYPMFRSISESVHKEVPIGTMGMLIQNQHKALESFPSEYYTTPQWWHIVEESNATILDQTQLKPIVQMIDNFERNHRLGIIYEAKVGKGSVLVCTAKIKDSKFIENKWLFASLMKYVTSSAFQPKESIDIEKLNEIFKMKEN